MFSQNCSDLSYKNCIATIGINWKTETLQRNVDVITMLKGVEISFTSKILYQIKEASVHQDRCFFSSLIESGIV